MRRIILYVIALLVGISVGIAILPALWGMAGTRQGFWLNQNWFNGLIGALIFFLFTALFIHPLLAGLSKLDSAVSRLNLSKLVYNLLGAILGLIVGVLISIPFMLLHIPVLSSILPFVLVVVFMYLGYTLFNRRGRDVLMAFLRRSTPVEKSDSADNSGLAAGKVRGLNRKVDKRVGIAKLLDTSVIIDGRIFDIIKTGFFDGNIIIPNFVLLELQTLADSDDAMKRAKGRRGLDMVNEIKEQPEIEISNKDYKDIHEVDSKLLRYASEISGKLVTNDFNLNKLAEIQGVQVLNINDLANAVKSQLVVGEILQLQIIRRGSERQQGVGYLPDGTMIVVEETADKLDQTVTVSVAKVLQTSAGRMIFADLVK